MGSDPLLTVVEAKNVWVFASIAVIMKGSDPIKSTPACQCSTFLLHHPGEGTVELLKQPYFKFEWSVLCVHVPQFPRSVSAAGPYV